MDNKKFIDMCTLIICESCGVDVEDVFVVWSCKTLQNNKALLSYNKKGAEYFEITHNGDKGELYVDKYIKQSNEKIIL